MAITPVDVFKFVAVRPVQLTSPAAEAIDVIRDARVADEKGLDRLRGALKDVSAPAEAARRWKDVDLNAQRPLIDARPALLQAYTAIPPDGPLPDVGAILSAAGLDGVDPSDASSADALWDALYIAHASGADGGARVDGPTAGLRVLHFMTLAAQGVIDSRSTALRALSAKVAVSTILDAQLRPSKPTQGPVKAVESPVAGPVPSESSVKLAREMAAEFATTQALRDQLMTTPGSAAASLSAGPVSTVGATTHQNITVHSGTDARSLLGANLGAHQVAVLDAAGIGAADSLATGRAKLADHLAVLSARALTHSADPGFKQALGNLVGSGQFLVPGPILPIIPTPAPVTDPGTAPDVDVHGRITPLGIGDLKVVKQTLLDYEAGEVAYIENVLAGESKQRVFRTLNRTTTSLLTSEEDTRDTERDNQTTDRFELKREADLTIKDDMSVKAGLQVTATYGPIVARATGDFAYSTSKEDSQKTSTDFAHDVVDRSVTKVQIKTTTTRTTTTLDETEETATHGFDNHAGATNVVGVYRWVDKRYRAQVYNYGTRLMLEFVVPEPAAFYKAARAGTPLAVDATAPVAFINDLTPFFPTRTLSADDISEDNYRQYAARYGAAGVTAYPPATRYASAALEKDGLDDGKSIAMTSKDFVVPDGYTLASVDIAISVLWVNHPKLTVQVGGTPYTIIDHEDGGFSSLTMFSDAPGILLLKPNGPVPISVAAYDVHAFALNVQGSCVRDDATFATWQLQTYDKIAAAYQALQSAYDQKVAAAKNAAQDAMVTGQNPDLNRATEQTELKKLCITMMTGQHFGQFHAVTAPSDPPVHHPEVDVLEAMREGPIVQFFEQAFEWEQMTYLFYPYFWGRKQNWAATLGISDPDPLFATFLAAGSCRVVVPVPIAYVDAVLYLLQSPAPNLADRVWRGGEPPTLDSDLYVSLAQEFRNQTDDLAGAVPEGDPWEFTLPTTLVWLQPDGTLPTFV